MTAPKLKFNPEISISHIILALTFIVAAMSWKTSIEFKLKDEQFKRESSDLALSIQLEQTTDILTVLQREVRINSDKHTLEENYKQWLQEEQEKDDTK